MIGGFLDKIGGFFDKPFLVAAVLPLLVAGLLLFCGTAYLLGLGALLSWLGDLSASATATLGAATTMTLFVLAFVLRSLRASLIAIWSGDHWLWQVTGVGLLSTSCHLRRRDALVAQIWAEPIWRDAPDEYRRRMNAARGPGSEGNIPPATERDLVRRIRRFKRGIRNIHAEATRSGFDSLSGEVASAYGRYTTDSMKDVYLEFRFLTEDLLAGERDAVSEALVERALHFGLRPEVRPTRLGNILQAIDAYPFRLYRMEGGVFWTHLEAVMKEPILSDVREQRMLVDFALAMTSLLMLLGLTSVLAGPWLVHHWGVLLVGAALLAGAYSFYRVALSAAIALGRALRAGCDLYRHELLKALSCPPPEDLDSERKLWTQLSQLSIYSDTQQLNLKFRAAGGQPGATS